MKKTLATIFILLTGLLNIFIFTNEAEAAYEQKYKMSYGRGCICSGSGDYWVSCHLPSSLNECSIYSCSCFEFPS